MTEYFLYFTKKMLSNLISLGFYPINGDLNGEFNEYQVKIDGFFAAAKHDGGVMYVAAFYYFTENSDFKALREKFSNSIRNFAKKHNARSTIILHIITTENSYQYNEAVNFLDTNAVEYLEQPVYEINYAVNMIDKQHYYNKNQPGNILKIDNIIAKCLDYNDYNNYNNEESNESNRLNELKINNKLEIQPIVKNEVFVYVFIVINALMFALMELNGSSTDVDTLIKFGTLSYFHVTYYNEYYRFFTSIFLHIGIMHLLYNSLSLYIFGRRVEQHFGRVAFLIIYLISGLAGSVAMFIFIGTGIAAGASGAIFGLMGATLAMAQVSKRMVDGLSFYSMIIFAIMGVGYGFIVPNIGNAAHIGGLISGYILGFLFCKLKK